MMKTIYSTLGILFLLLSCDKPKEQLETIRPQAQIKSVPTYEVTIQDYCLEQGKQRVNFMLVNLQFELTADGFLIDTDGDGLPDKDEQENGANLDIRFDQRDSNQDQYSDLIVRRGGFLPAQQARLPNCSNSGDQDGDGLRYCEEVAAGTDPESIDTDGDTIPDGLELRKGLSPLLKDVNGDMDGDGFSALEELRLGTPRDVTNDDSLAVSLYALEYEYESAGYKNGLICYNYHIKNIPYYEGFVENLVGIYFTTIAAGAIDVEEYRLALPTTNAEAKLTITYQSLVDAKAALQNPGQGSGGNP
jgi:hypothetical protein